MRQACPLRGSNAQFEGMEVDFLWSAHRLVVETDGFRAHRSRAAFERDHTRNAVLESAGYRVRRFTYRQVTRRPDWVAARIGAALNETGR